MNALQPLVFEGTAFEVIDRDGQIWLQAADIARALGYASADAISRIYRRNAAEFTSSMSETVNLTVSGNIQKTIRIFSLRGAHLLGMFAKTDLAQAFRRWVLDVLEGKAQPAPMRPTVEPQQADLFGDASQAFDELTLLRQLHSTQTRLVGLLEERLKPKKKRAPNRPLTADEIRLARALKQQGMSNRRIAQHLERSEGTISLLLREVH